MLLHPNCHMQVHRLGSTVAKLRPNNVALLPGAVGNVPQGNALAAYPTPGAK